MKIGLITGKSGNTLVKYLKGEGHDVFVVTGDRINGGIDFANETYFKFFDIRNNNDLFINEICDWLLAKKIDGFILGTGVWFAHEIANRLSKKHNISVSHNVNYLGIFKNKYETKKLFEQFGLNTPLYQFLSDKEENITLKLPFVVKSNIDLFPVWLCHSYEDFMVFKERINEVVWGKGILIEEYIEGNDLTIPVFAGIESVESPCLVYWSKQANYKLEGFGELTNDKIPKNIEQILLKDCQSMIEKLGYFGVCRFDIRVSNKEYYFLEINSVVSIRDEGSSFKAMKDVGINYVEKAIKVYLNNITNNPS
jgi:carbamoylphosphate synthase large subunit